MGYELDRLMQQYGVTAPTLAYAGMNAPTKPEADMVVYRDEMQPQSAASDSLFDAGAFQKLLRIYPAGTQPKTAVNGRDRIPFSELQSKYDMDIANYSAGKQAFKDYSQQFRNQIASTPMYGQAQFGNPVAARPTLAAPTYATAQMPSLAGVLRESQLTPKATGLKSVLGGPGANTGSGGYNFGGSYQNLGDAPDVGTMAGGGYGTDADGGGVGFGGSDSDGGGSDGGGDGGGYCMGGLVKKYAEGGEVDSGGDLPALSGGDNLSPQVIDLIRRDAAAQGIVDPVANFTGPSKSTKFGLSPLVPPGMLARPASPFPAVPLDQAVAPAGAAQPPGSGATDPLQSMLAKYAQAPSPYADDLKTARARSDKESQAFTNLLTRLAANPEQAGPSKAEMYFRLAAAFGSPTKTGNFMENAALAANEMAAHQKETRAAQVAARQQQLQLALEAQKMRMTGAREDLATVRQLAAEEARDRSGFTRDIFKEYLASGRPQSEAGKAALDAGLVKGTPEFNQFVNNYITKKLEGGDLLKILGLQLQQRGVELKEAEAKKLTPAEVQLKTTTEDTISGLDSVLQDLSRAYQLNPNTFGNTVIERAQRKLLQETGAKDPKLSNTTEVENLLGQQVLSKLKTTFGGAPTEGERAILMELEGAGSKTPEDRAKIIQRAYKAAKERRVREEKRLNEIKSGLYRTTDSTPSNLE